MRLTPPTQNSDSKLGILTLISEILVFVLCEKQNKQQSKILVRHCSELSILSDIKVTSGRFHKGLGGIYVA